MPLGPMFCLWLLGAMLDPAVDRAEQPFEYFPATAMRLPVFSAAPAVVRLDGGLRLASDGCLASEVGRLAVFAGEPPHAVHGRTARWLEGWIPVALADDLRHGAALRLQYTACRVDGLPGDVGLLRVLATGGAEATALTVHAAWLPDAGWPVPAPEVALDRPYSLVSGALLADERVHYAYPQQPPPSLSATFGEGDGARFTPRELFAGGRTPLGVTSWRLEVPPRGRRALVFAVPRQPVSPALAEAALRRVDFDTQAVRARNEWEAWLADQPRVELPEARPREAYRAALIRRWTTGGPARPLGELAADDAGRLLAADTERGLVLRRLSPTFMALDLVLSARRARLLLAADRPREALAALYAMLLHSGATGSWSSLVPAAWDRRERLDPWGLPDESAVDDEFLPLCRELIARVDGRTLRLLGAVAPGWLADGRAIGADRLPTPFGPVTTKLTVRGNVLSLDLPTGLSGIDAVLVRVPWCAEWVALEVDGRAVEAESGWIRVTPAAQRVTMAYRPGSLADGPSFEAVVTEYRRAYQERAAALAASGGRFAAPPEPTVATADERRRVFEARYGDG